METALSMMREGWMGVMRMAGAGGANRRASENTKYMVFCKRRLVLGVSDGITTISARKLKQLAMRFACAPRSALALVDRSIDSLIRRLVALGNLRARSSCGEVSVQRLYGQETLHGGRGIPTGTGT